MHNNDYLYCHLTQKSQSRCQISDGLLTLFFFNFTEKSNEFLRY